MIKKLVYIALLCFVQVSYGEEESILKTKYIVVFNKSKAGYSQTQSGYTDFNAVADALNKLLARQEDKITVFSTYLKNRLEIMKAISERIADCLLNFMQKKKKPSTVADYITGSYQSNNEINNEVRDLVKQMVEELIPCDLITGNEGFAIIKPHSGGVFSLRTRYIIEQNKNLIDLNHYLAWVETLILLSISEAEVFKQVDIIAPHIFRNDFLDGMEIRHHSVLMKLRDAYINNYYMVLLEKAYIKLQALYDAIISSPENNNETLQMLQLLTISLSLQSLLDYNGSELRNKDQMNGSAIIPKLNELNNSIVSLAKRILHGNDTDIQEVQDLTKENLAAWTKNINQLERFEDEFSNLKSQSIVSATAIDLLLHNVLVLAYVVQMQGGDIVKYAQLLQDIEDFKKIIVPTSNLLEALFDLERNLSLLSA